MAVGYRLKLRTPLGKPAKNIPFNALKEREWLISAIAIAETGGLDVLLSKPKVARIAEEYANGGLEHVKEVVFGELPGDAVKKLEAELKEMLSST